MLCVLFVRVGIHMPGHNLLRPSIDCGSRIRDIQFAPQQLVPDAQNNIYIYIYTHTHNRRRKPTAAAKPRRHLSAPTAP